MKQPVNWLIAFLFVVLLYVCAVSLLDARRLEFPADDDRTSRANHTSVLDEEDDRMDVTSFGEAVTARKINVLSLKPTWGVSNIRSDSSVGSGATFSDSAGLIHVATNTNSAATAALQSRERVEYQPGGTMEAGFGIDGPDSDTLTSGQFYEFGPFDGTNGFGYGVDTGGVYVFRVKGGTKSKIYQDNWNVDTLDGSENRDNPSDAQLTMENGNIFQVVYNWYGYGDVLFFIDVNHTHTIADLNDSTERVLVHRMNIQGEATVNDPNLPLRFFADNNGSTSNMDILIGGRQFSLISGRERPEQRPVNDFVSDWLLDGTENEWEPIMAIRKKDPFPAGSGRENSVRVQLVTVKSEVTNGPIQLRVTLSDTTDVDSVGGISFDSPPTWGNESAVETNTDPDSFTADVGPVLVREFIPAGTTGNAQGNERAVRERVVLGEGKSLVLWARKESASNATLSAIMKWDEQW